MRPQSVGDEAAMWAERFLIKLRKAGTPQSRKDWQVVVSYLIACSDDALREVAQKGRTIGVGWIVPVAEAMLEELQKGNAYRAADGALTLRGKPTAKGLDVLL